MYVATLVQFVLVPIVIIFYLALYGGKELVLNKVGVLNLEKQDILGRLVATFLFLSVFLNIFYIFVYNSISFTYSHSPEKGMSFLILFPLMFLSFLSVIIGLSIASSFYNSWVRDNLELEISTESGSQYRKYPAILLIVTLTLVSLIYLLFLRFGYLKII